MRKIKNIYLKVLLVSIFIALYIPFESYVIYGTVNVIGTPNTLTVGYTLYTSTGVIITLKGKSRPAHQVSGLLDKLTGKRIYYIDLNYRNPGGVVYLYLNDDKYRVFACAGGA